MAVYLIRHANAGSRSSWPGDDLQRPLNAKGRGQAEHIRTLLGARRIQRIVSSPAVRCIETVEPLAAALDIAVDVSPAVAEGADAPSAIAQFIGHHDGNIAICTHGDLIPKILRRLSAEGMRTTEPHDAKKGSVWILEFDGDRVTLATYHLPVDERAPDEIAS